MVRLTRFGGTADELPTAADGSRTDGRTVAHATGAASASFAAIVELTAGDKRALEDAGYLLVPGLIAPERVQAALAAINTSLGRNGLPPDALPRMNAQTFCPELVNDATVLDLYRATPLAEVAEAALGSGRVRDPSDAQIALRFPTPGADRVDPRPHIDGLPRAQNGVPAGTIYHFTALAAVFLSDADEPFAGNFTVWPGSHRALAAYFAAHDAARALARPDAPFPPVPLPEPPRQLIVKAGDALLAHYLLVHGVSANLGPHIRYAVFFRLFHDAHDPASTTALGDLWGAWQGLT